MGENEMVTISYIYWLAAGLLLAAAEMIVPGFILFWFGMAAFVVGLVTLALPALGWPLQIAAFAVLTTVFMGFWWLHQRKQPKTETESEFNSRARDMVGKTLTLTDPIRHGSGKTFVGDTLMRRWRRVRWCGWSAILTKPCSGLNWLRRRMLWWQKPPLRPRTRWPWVPTAQGRSGKKYKN